ncbi:FkbM family methyltransferase [Limnochorda pilosa]|uniref:FkbM family methyltransferase n=1 Tax=Limnochorda pilosa TaxID=1555112 RepID=UPI00130EE91D|nr:FkbM family methyltransferase [Limnochorda pilosa]
MSRQAAEGCPFGGEELRVLRVLVGRYKGLHFAFSPQLREGKRIFRVFLHGSYEPHVTEWLTRTVRPGMTVAVIGAHVGVHVVYLGRLVGETGRVYAFEPWPANHRQLLVNVELNRMRNVVPMQLALSDRTGTAAMAAGTTSGTHALTVDRTASDTTVVQVSTLDTILGETPVHLMLVDVEGHEINVLRGGARLIEACRPALVLEHHDRETGLVSWLTERGYAVDRMKGHLMAVPRS